MIAYRISAALSRRIRRYRVAWLRRKADEIAAGTPPPPPRPWSTADRLECVAILHRDRLVRDLRERADALERGL